MIKFEFDANSGVPKLTALGNMTLLESEVMILIKMLYDHFNGVDPDMGKEFIKDLVTCMIDPNGPMYYRPKGKEG